MEKVYTAKEVAYLMRVTCDTVYGMIKRGELRAALFGGQWRIKESDLESLFTTHLEGKTDEEIQGDWDGDWETGAGKE